MSSILVWDLEKEQLLSTIESPADSAISAPVSSCQLNQKICSILHCNGFVSLCCYSPFILKVCFSLVLEYIEPMCIEAHLEAHVYDLYIPTLLGLEEYINYSLLHGIFCLGFSPTSQGSRRRRQPWPAVGAAPPGRLPAVAG